MVADTGAVIPVAARTREAEVGARPIRAEAFRVADKATVARGAIPAEDKSILDAAIRAVVNSFILAAASMAALGATIAGASTRAEATTMADVSGRGPTSASGSASRSAMATIRTVAAATMTDTATGSLLRVTPPVTNQVRPSKLPSIVWGNEPRLRHAARSGIHRESHGATIGSQKPDLGLGRLPDGYRF